MNYRFIGRNFKSMVSTRCQKYLLPAVTLIKELLLHSLSVLT